jgi:hypothetical protein
MHGFWSFAAPPHGYPTGMAQSQPAGDRSLADSALDLAAQVKGLVRAEMALARDEMTGQTRELGVAAGMVGAAGLLGVLSAGSATAGLVLLLARRERPWLAAFTVSGGYAGGAVLLGLEARRRIQEVGVPAPEQAVDILKDTAQRVTGG